MTQTLTCEALTALFSKKSSSILSKSVATVRLSGLSGILIALETSPQSSSTSKDGESGLTGLPTNNLAGLSVNFFTGLFLFLKKYMYYVVLSKLYSQ